MKFKMRLPVAVDVEFTVREEDGSYSIVGIKPPNAAAFLRALSADDAAVSIEAEIETRKMARKGLVG